MKTPIIETDRMILRPLSVAAAKAILEFAIIELKQKEFISWHAVDNPASGAVMKKCGFVYEQNEIHTKFDGVTSFDTRKHRLIIQ